MEKPKLIENIGYIYPLPTSKQKVLFGVYECPFCSKLFKARTPKIKSGHTKSCGCYQKKFPNNKKHGLTYTRIHRIWSLIKSRCFNKNMTEYKNYGGKGISMCDEWKNDFMAFYNWSIKNKYSDSLSIDRINNDGNYEPSNCKWSTREEQTQNSRLIKSNNTSGYRGVHFNGQANKWQADIQYNNKHYYLGRYTTACLAAIAYNSFVITNQTRHPLNIIPYEI